MGKQDISNRTLATLLVVAIVISLGGTYLVMQNAPAITGLAVFANDSGTFSFNNVAFLAINLDDAIVQLGNISHTSQGICSIVTDANGDGHGCSSDRGVAIFSDVITLNNTGNVDANITVNISQALTGTLGTNGRLAITVDIAETGCLNSTGGNVVDGIYQDLFEDKTNTYTNVKLCENLTWSATNDQISLRFNLTIDSDAPPTQVGTATQAELVFSAIQTA